jgi:hypothetical protein
MNKRWLYTQGVTGTRNLCSFADTRENKQHTRSSNFAGDACFFLSKHGVSFDKKTHKMLSRAGKGIKASQLRVLFFELEQPWERIKNLNATEVGALIIRILLAHTLS